MDLPSNISWKSDKGLVADTRSQTDRQNDTISTLGVLFYFAKKAQHIMVSAGIRNTVESQGNEGKITEFRVHFVRLHAFCS
jgi:predicted proteasome-type protease